MANKNVVTITTNDLSSMAIARDENGKELGRCCYVVHEDSYYNNVLNAWTSYPYTDICAWLKYSIQTKYPQATVIIESLHEVHTP